METDIKNYIADGLFDLLKRKEIYNIKITELVKITGISRTTFYNNFKNINEVLTYKFINIKTDLDKIIKLNRLRKNNSTNLLANILNNINKNKNIFIIIKNKYFIEFKNILDNNETSYDYYIKSGIIINLCLLYIDNNFYLDLNKIKID